MKKLIFILAIFVFTGCVKSFTKNEDKLQSVGDNNKMATRLYPTILPNGDTLKVADSGYRKVNGVTKLVATSPARIVRHEAIDSNMRVWPSYDIVKGWLKERNYYNFWLPLSILCFLASLLVLFVFPDKVIGRMKKATGWPLFAVAGLFFYLSFETAGRTARVTSEENSKVIPIEKYRYEKQKDNFVSFWDSLKTNNKILFK